MKEVRFRIWGSHAVEEALRSERVISHQVMHEKTRSKWLEKIESYRKPKEIFESGKKDLDRFAEGQRHQGVVAEVSLQAYEGVEDFFDGGSEFAGWILGVDQIQDPQNLGSMMRSVHFFGADAFLLTLDRSAGLNGTVAKASAGALFSLPILLAKNLAREIEALKEARVWTLGLDADAEAVLGQGVELNGPLALFVGSEGEGLRTLTKKRVDQLVRLDFQGKRDSLNAAVAAAITAYEVARKRSSHGA